jgi:hypothetical protein
MSELNRSQHRRAHQAQHPDQRAAERWERAQAWSATTGRPLPPHMRERQATSTAVPMGDALRGNRYRKAAGSTSQTWQATPRQIRRARHKLHHLAAARRKRKAAAS